MKFDRYPFAVLVFFIISPAFAGEYPETLTAYLGGTPTLDGYIQANEYADAEMLAGVSDWKSDTQKAAQIAADLSAKIWYKHDGTSLYFAFDVNDDVIYGFDIDRWVPDNKPTANAMNYKDGWPWFGDGVEIMMNSTYQWSGPQTCSGDAKSWQFVCSTHKSTLGGLGTGGLMAGEPRNERTWEIYEGWTKDGHMEAVVRLKPSTNGRGYVIEWRIDPNPCMQQGDGSFVDFSSQTRVGINFEIQDLDEKSQGSGNWSNFHHIDYWARVGSLSKTALKSFGTLLINPEKMTTRVGHAPKGPAGIQLFQNYPNPFNSSTMVKYRIGQKTGSVQIDVFNCRGKKVRTLFSGQRSRGEYEAVWDGRDDGDMPVAGGIYFFCISDEKYDRISTRKAVLLK